MRLDLERLEVGPWPMNCYLIRSPATGQVAIVDPGADGQAILEAVGGDEVCYILLTHGHPDHVGALDEVRQTTGAPVGIHPADRETSELRADLALTHGEELAVGRGSVAVFHVPGHTPGSVCLKLNGRVIVGDVIFPGGPGHTASPEALEESLASLGRIVFSWSDETELHPGHGGPTTVGAERADYGRFVAQDRPPDLCGDVAWR